ncbi:MAG: hypothetical protein ACRDJW_06735 [Thermomicrobiales bacterium]
MPTIATLDDAMRRSGRLVPAINRLGGGMIAMSGPIQPLRATGADAVVYQLRQPSGRSIALRCLLIDHPEPGLAERYRGLASAPAVAKLRESPSSPVVGNVHYIADGLSLPGADFRSLHHPVMAMDWVDGPTLIESVDRACRAGDSDLLEALADAWLAAVDDFEAAGFSHGNLTADNIMVRSDGRIVLVDYDTAFWPGSARPASTESTPGYRHPAGLTTGPDRRDRYPALLIYASLRALAHWPDLREEYGDPPETAGGVLLFAPRDLADPHDSALFRTLRSIQDPPTRALIGILGEASHHRPGETPPLREAAAAAFNLARESRPRSTTTKPSPASAARRRQELLTRLNGMLMAGEVDKAVEFWQASGLATDAEAVRELGPRIAELARRKAQPSARRETALERALADARREIERRHDAPPSAAHVAPIVPPAPMRRPPRAIEQLRVALETGDAAAVGALWPHIRGEPDALPFAFHATEVVTKLMGAAIAGAIERGDDDAVVAAVQEAEAVGVPVNRIARRASRTATRRTESRRRLREALVNDDRPALAELAISGRLAELGKIDPEVRRMIARAVQWPHLERALANEDDLAILAAFDGEAFALADSLTPEQRNRVDVAHRRVTWLETVRSALRRRDVAVLRAALSDVPTDADHRLSRVERKRFKRLIDQDQAVRGLDAALKGGDDQAITRALGEIEATGASLPDSFDWNTMRVVVDRLSLMASIRRAATSDPPDYARLARLLPAARVVAEGVDLDLGSGIDLARLEEDVRREAHRARLREAIANGDDGGIVAAALPDLYGTLATLADDERARVDQALTDHRTAAWGAWPKREIA